MILRYFAFVACCVLFHPAVRLMVVLLRVADSWWYEKRVDRRRRAAHFTRV